MKAAVLILLFALSAFPQQQRKPPLWDWTDPILVGSLVADEMTSHYAFQRGAVEAGVFRNTRVRIVAKGAWVALFKFWDYYHPTQRKYTKIIKLSFAGLFTALALHNSRVNR